MRRWPNIWAGTSEGCSLNPSQRPGAHISLVFFKMWDTTNVDRWLHRMNRELEGRYSETAHLAKNERDVGHPTLVEEPEVRTVKPCTWSLRFIIRRWHSGSPRLILTGFMGAGKSTVGEILGRDLGWRFVDLDRVIEGVQTTYGSGDIREHGEAEFRRREQDAVQQLNDEEQIVLALGGGTVEDESTRSLLVHSPGNCVVFLHAELSELLARCMVEGKTRPLLAAPEAMEARHARRLPHYRAAHVTVTTSAWHPRK